MISMYKYMLPYRIKLTAVSTELVFSLIVNNNNNNNQGTSYKVNKGFISVDTY